MNSTTARTEAEKDAVGMLLAELEGAVVTATGAVVDTSSDWPAVWQVLQFRTTDGRTLQVEVSRDAEGNGPGHLLIGEV